MRSCEPWRNWCLRSPLSATKPVLQRGTTAHLGREVPRALSTPLAGSSSLGWASGRQFSSPESVCARSASERDHSCVSPQAAHVSSNGPGGSLSNLVMSATRPVGTSSPVRGHLMMTKKSMAVSNRAPAEIVAGDMHSCKAGGWECMDMCRPSNSMQVTDRPEQNARSA
jgi:hypothetical protein